MQTPDGGYVLSDVSYSFVPNQALFMLIKMDAEGKVLGNTTYGGEGYYFQTECNCAIPTKDGGYLMAGYLWEKNAWIVKIDSEYNLQWNQTYGSKDSSITCAIETQNGDYLLMDISNLTHAGLIMTDRTGNELWSTTFPGVTLPLGLEANFNSIVHAKDGCYIVIGSKNQSVWLAKLNYQHNGSNSIQVLSIAGVVFVAGVAALLIVRKKRRLDKA